MLSRLSLLCALALAFCDCKAEPILQSEALALTAALFPSRARRQAVEFGTPTPDFIFHQWERSEAIPYQFYRKTKGNYAPLSDWQPYTHVSVTGLQEQLVRTAMAEIQKATGGCVGYYEVGPGDRAPYRILFAVDQRLTRNRASIGMASMTPTFVLLAPEYALPGLTVGSVMHELLHTLGLLHTQQRTDRDRFMEVHLNNIDNPKYTVNYMPFHWSKTYGVPYDPESIMHYDACKFSRAWAQGRCSTASNDEMMITGPNGEDLRGVVGQRTKLSKGDVQLIQAMYCFWKQ